MRLWHKDLIPVLQIQQLLGQWRECCLIAKNIAEKGTPNHILVNKVMDYPIEHFYSYCGEVAAEMKYRGYKVDFSRIIKYFPNAKKDAQIKHNELFNGWHNARYLRQCYYNLQEKYDNGGMAPIEWKQIYECRWYHIYIDLTQKE